MPQNQASGSSDLTTSPFDHLRIVFVSGKGGVGKSLVASGLAKEQADRGRKVLLVEIGDQSYYRDFWGLPAIGHEPHRLKEGFDLALWSGETALREYVLYYLKVERLFNLFFENKVMRSLVNVAPGLNEIAILGKVTSGLRKVGPALDYDLIVVDTYATGHALSLLLAPKGMMEAIKFGPMGHHSREIESVLQSPGICGYLAVTLLEELPVVETLEFCKSLKDQLGVRCHVVANKVLPLVASHADLQKVALEASSASLREFSTYIDAIRERQQKFLADLQAKAGPVQQIPLVFSNDPETLVQATGEALRKT